MRVRRGIQNDHIRFALSLLNPSHQISLKVGLSKVDFRAQLPCPSPNLLFDIRQRFPPIHLRFPRPQQIQVRPIQKQNLHSALRLAVTQTGSLRYEVTPA